MKWISNLVSGYIGTFHFVFICLLSLALIVGGRPVTRVVSGVTTIVFYAPFATIKNTVIDLAGVAERNERLRLALQERELQLMRLEELERENERLRRRLNFEPPLGYDLVQARVISVSGTTTPVSARISWGAGAEVETDMAVIIEQGLIGRVVEVFEDQATIQLLTDPTNRVAARVVRSRQMGIVKHQAGRGMILDNFPIQGDVMAGDEIRSSGLGGRYPAGLVVGTVVAVQRFEEDPFCSIQVEPAASFNSIEELYILRINQP